MVFVAIQFRATALLVIHRRFLSGFHFVETMTNQDESIEAFQSHNCYFFSDNYLF